MIATTVTYPGTAVNIAGGNTDWVNPDNAKTEDAVYSTATLNNDNTDYLALTNFGFNIPSNAEIGNIKVEIKGYYTGAESTIFIREVPEYDTFKIESFQLTDTNAYHEVEATGDWWKDGTMTPSDVNNSNFGFAISTFTTTSTYYIDTIRVTVYYNLFSPLPTFYQ